MQQHMEDSVPYADDDEGGRFDDCEEEEMHMKVESSGDDDDDDNENMSPIGWINGRPADEEQQKEEEEEEDDDDDQELPDAPSSPEEHQQADFMSHQAVTDGPVLERLVWEDPLEQEMFSVGKRRNGHIGSFTCFYCQEPSDGEAVYCPGPGEGQPDIEHRFCMAACAKAWAVWEVGEPLAHELCDLIDKRVGYVSDVAPPPFELLVNQMGGLQVRDDFFKLFAPPPSPQGTASAAAASSSSSGRRLIHKGTRKNEKK